MKKILIIGAGFLQDFVIQKAVSMGYETVTVDADPNAVGFRHAHNYAVIDIVDEQACLDYAVKEKIDGVLTAATDYGVLSAAYVADRLGLPGLPYETAKLIKNKYEVRRRLDEHLANDMQLSYRADISTDVSEIAEKVSFPVMVKPCDGSGSRGTQRVDTKNDLKKACDHAIGSSITKTAVIEPFLEGTEYGAESLVVNGEIHVLSIMKKWMTKPPHYAELGHAIPCGLPPELEEKAIRQIRSAIRTLGINHSSVNMDFLVTKDGGVYIVDVGARMGGNMIGPCIIPYGTGLDYMGAMIRNAVGDPIDWSKGEHGAVATKLLAFREGIVKNLPDMVKISQRYDVEIYHHMEKGMHVREYHTNLDGCGYIVARGRTTKDAECRAGLALQAIRDQAF